MYMYVYIQSFFSFNSFWLRINSLLNGTFWKPYRSIQVTVIRPCAELGYASMGLPELIWIISQGNIDYSSLMVALTIHNITCPNVMLESVASWFFYA